MAAELVTGASFRLGIIAAHDADLAAQGGAAQSQQFRGDGLVAMGPLERLYFHHCKTTVVGLSDQSVFFKTKRAAGTTEFSFSDLIKESQRQDP